jgi:hypothetical protein
MSVFWVVVILGGRMPGIGIAPHHTQEDCERSRLMEQYARGGIGSYCLQMTVPTPPTNHSSRSGE